MRQDDFVQRLADLTAKEVLRAKGAQSWYWLSFADPDLPAGQQFLGACLVQAPGPTLALALSHRLKINPGGCVRTFALPEEPDVKWPRNTLMSKSEIDAIEALK